MSLAHLRTLVWLRSRLSRNQFARGKKWAAILGIILRVLLCFAAAALTLAAFLVGALLLDDAPRWVLFTIWGGFAMVFLFMWMISVVSEVQRAEAIDVRRLMHLPVSLRQVFVINYVASLYTPSLILAVPASIALVLGLVVGRGLHMAWLFPLLFAFFFALTAWTYCLRGWLVNLMTNKRRRRAIVMGMTAALILVGQLPNIIFNSPLGRQFIRNREKQGAGAFDGGLLFIEQAASLPSWQLALPLATGIILLGVLGLHRAYRVTVGFYTSASPRRRPRKRRPKTPVRERRGLVERRLPLCSEPVSALAMTFLRSNLRAPEIRMALVMPFVMTIIFGVMFLGRARGNLGPTFQGLPALGVIALSVFSTSQFLFNVFGFDRDAFRTLLLLPAEGRRVLLAKNLAFLPFSLTVGVILLILVSAFLRLAPWTFLAALFQLVSAYLILCIPANFASTRVPYRFPGATMRRPKIPTQAMLVVLAFHLTVPLILLLVAVPPVLGMLLAMLNPLAGAVLNLVGSAVVLLLALVAYRLVLPSAGRYFQARSLHILGAVTAEAE